MTQTRDLIKKMADFFTGEEFYEKGEDARLELSPDDVRCMYCLSCAIDKIRAEVTAIAINGQVDEHTMFIRTGEQVKKMALEIIDKYIAEGSERMTIEEQITIFEHNAEHERKEGDLNNCLHFRQLAEWLKDYKRLLGAIDAIKAEIEELAKHPAFGDLSVGVSCGAVRCLEIINKHTSGGDAE